MLDSGQLRARIKDQGLRGVTSNPKTFSDSLGASEAYDADIIRLAAGGYDEDEIHRILVVDDIVRACEELRPVYEKTGGRDGFVSIEIDPRLGRETEESTEAARELAAAVARSNCMIKIPGTPEGLPAIEEVLAEGINVNVTLLFSPERYEAVLATYRRALQRRLDAGEPIDRIASVASFFLSRIDVLADELLANEEDGDDAHELRGEVAISLARRIYEIFRESLASPEWQRLAKAGAKPQRPLWASTGVKDPGYDETLYVDSLVARDTVNTMPEKTAEAFRRHGSPEEQAILRRPRRPGEVLRRLDELGIRVGHMATELEEEGLQKFIDPHEKALAEIRKIMRRQAGNAGLQPTTHN